MRRKVDHHVIGWRELQLLRAVSCLEIHMGKKWQLWGAVGKSSAQRQLWLQAGNKCRKQTMETNETRSDSNDGQSGAK
jgi:hypothetical protein